MEANSSVDNPPEPAGPELVTLFENLVRFQIVLWNSVDARLRRELGIPLGWFESMRVIDRQGNRQGTCRVNEVAEELVITVGGASKLVDRLEHAGHCIRRSNPGDRRSSLLELTTAGGQLLAKADLVVQKELESRLGKALASAELTRLDQTLKTLRREQ